MPRPLCYPFKQTRRVACEMDKDHSVIINRQLITIMLAQCRTSQNDSFTTLQPLLYFTTQCGEPRFSVCFSQRIARNHFRAIAVGVKIVSISGSPPSQAGPRELPGP